MLLDEVSNSWACSLLQGNGFNLLCEVFSSHQYPNITLGCLIPISRATTRLIRYASYSTIMLVHGKSSLNDISTVSLVLLDRTILAPPSEVVEDPSNRKVQTVQSYRIDLQFINKKIKKNLFCNFQCQMCVCGFNIYIYIYICCFHLNSNSLFLHNLVYCSIIS